MNVLILEDDYDRVRAFEQRFQGLTNGPHRVTLTETAADCISALETDPFDLICLDHDLGGQVYVNTDEENTGSTVARWLSEHPGILADSLVIVHSANAPAAQYMVGLMPGSYYIPFLWTEDEFARLGFSEVDAMT